MNRQDIVKFSEKILQKVSELPYTSEGDLLYCSADELLGIIENSGRLSATEDKTITYLLELLQSVFYAMDNSLERNDCVEISTRDAASVCKALDNFLLLPDDREGYILNECGRASYALRYLRQKDLT